MFWEIQPLQSLNTFQMGACAIYNSLTINNVSPGDVSEDSEVKERKKDKLSLICRSELKN